MPFPSDLRESPRPALALFTVVFLATAIWSFTRPRIYEATAELHVSNYFPVHHEQPTAEVAEIRSSYVSGETFRKLVESDHILRQIPPHLPPRLRDQLASAEPKGYLQKLQATREAKPEQRGSALLIRIACRHEKPDTAATLANAFAAATDDYFTRRKQEEERYAMSYLAEASDKARREADIAASELARSDLPDDTRRKLETDLQARRLLADQIARRLAEARATGVTPSITLRITPATPPAPADHVSPNHLLDLSLGLLAGALAAASILIRRKCSRQFRHAFGPF